MIMTVFDVDDVLDDLVGSLEGNDFFLRASDSAYYNEPAKNHTVSNKKYFVDSKEAHEIHRCE